MNKPRRNQIRQQNIPNELPKPDFDYNQVRDSAVIITAGQTYYPYEDNTRIQTLPFEPLAKPYPPLPNVELNDLAIEKGWELKQECHHFVPGVTAEMLDWFWVNMEKGYYLWAPGSHKRFNWVREPWKYGLVKSAHCIAESVGPGYGVFGGSGIQINRLDMKWFPFTWALKHVIVEGVFNDVGEFVDMTVHMWQDCKGGINHVTAAVAATDTTEPPHFIIEMLQNGGIPKAPSETDHAEYEASRWPEFLPQLYELWYGHPDPTQNVVMNLEVEQTGPQTWDYVENNGPIVF